MICQSVPKPPRTQQGEKTVCLIGNFGIVWSGRLFIGPYSDVQIAIKRVRGVVSILLHSVADWLYREL